MVEKCVCKLIGDNPRCLRHFPPSTLRSSEKLPQISGVVESGETVTEFFVGDEVILGGYHSGNIYEIKAIHYSNNTGMRWYWLLNTKSGWLFSYNGADLRKKPEPVFEAGKKYFFDTSRSKRVTYTCIHVFPSGKAALTWNTEEKISTVPQSDRKYYREVDVE